MKQQNKSLLVIGLLIFAIGLVISLIFNGLVLWANLEGMSFWGYPESLAFDSSLTTEARITGLKCPVLLTLGEVKKVTVMVQNPNEFATTAWISAHISMPNMLENMVRDLRSVTLEPGEKATLSWEVTDDNTVYNRMILARVFLRLTERHPPARTQHCGILTLDFWGFSSTLVVIFLIGISFLLQVLGILIWWLKNPQGRKQNNQIRNILLSLTILAIIATIGSLFHMWVLGLLGLILTLIIVFSFVGYAIGKSDGKFIER